MSREDAIYMAQALELAHRGLYTTDPNPRVGCLIVHEGVIVGQGWHRRAGGPHAEIVALNEAGDRARGGTAYVTLEPCSHHGRTPPCSQALIRAGLRRVVAAMRDPNPKVAGSGLQQLAEAGVATRCGVLEEAAEALNPGFCRRMRTGRPLVRSKLAMSLDGRTAMASGESQWITGADARRDVHRLRARSSAVVTGIGTLLADDPALTARLEDPSIEVRQPARVVLDTHQQFPAASRIVTGGDVHLLTGAALGSGRELSGVSIHTLPTGPDGRLDPVRVMAWLGEREFNEVLFEAGATLNGSLLRERLVDEWVIYIAPVIMGDRGRGLFHLPELNRMADRYSLELVDQRQVGRDIRLTLKQS